jgi:hypothetical protein
VDIVLRFSPFCPLVLEGDAKHYARSIANEAIIGQLYPAILPVRLVTLEVAGEGAYERDIEHPHRVLQAGNQMPVTRGGTLDAAAVMLTRNLKSR